MATQDNPVTKATQVNPVTMATPDNPATMPTPIKPSFFKLVDLKCRANNFAHRTHNISEEKLIVRRGQPFLVTVRLTQAFIPDKEALTFSAQTGTDPKQKLGTMSLFGIPKNAKRSKLAKAVWEAELLKNSYLPNGVVILNVIPPADCPIGKYKMTITFKGEEFVVDLVVLFNPWCTDDSVHMFSELKKFEYVLNQRGEYYCGSVDYIHSDGWDFGQFEDDMVDICFMLLDKSLSFEKDPSADVAARGDPVHVSRVISAMINSEDDQGVLTGQWGGPYWDGESPNHWTGSHAILKKWFESGCKAVKYGQCWVFACVMCSVMRLLGVPSRVVTNFESAHDVDRNLTIDYFSSIHGVEERPSPDSIWNFHVWVECWFTRPDLAEHGEYGGWQILDPTPQETSGGVYRCGPAPVKAIKKGKTDLKYDIPFVFAEVNADVVKWLVKEGGKVTRLSTDIKKVGKNISTKEVGIKYRRDLTYYYKHREGTKAERAAFEHAVTRDYTRPEGLEPNHEDETDESDDETWEPPAEVIPDDVPAEPNVTGRFEEVGQAINGKDLSLKLNLRNRSAEAKVVVINISVQAMRHNGSPAALIQEEEVMQTLPPIEEFSLPVFIPFRTYHQHMVEQKAMRIQAVITDLEDPEHPFLAQFDVVLLNPPLIILVDSLGRVDQKMMAEVLFENPVDETLTNCSLTVSGSGLFKDEFYVKLPDLNPETRVRIKVYFTPYSRGDRVIMADLDTSGFRDIKASKDITILP